METALWLLVFAGLPAALAALSMLLRARERLRIIEVVRESAERGQPLAAEVVHALRGIARRKRQARLVLEAEPIDPDAPEPADSRSEDRLAAALDLDRALAALSPAERLCVSACHGAVLTHAEIAGALGLPLGTVKSHVRRGVAKLAARLGRPVAPKGSMDDD